MATGPADLRGQEEEAGGDEGTRWLAGVFAEMMRVGLALLAKRYPDALGKHLCPRCGWRH